MGGFGLTGLWEKAIVGQIVKLTKAHAHPMTANMPMEQEGLVKEVYTGLQGLLGAEGRARSSI